MATDWNSLFKDYGPWAILLGIVIYVLKSAWDKIVEFLSEYILENARMFLYWALNRDFAVSGTVRLQFSGTPVSHEQLRKLEETLRTSASFAEPEGTLIDNILRLRLREDKHLSLKISIEPYPALHTDSDTEAEPEATLLLKIKWDKLQIGYRDIVKTLDPFRKSSEEIRNAFGTAAPGQIPGPRNVFLEFFRSRDCNVDRTIVEKVLLQDSRVSMKRMAGVVEIGSTEIDLIVPYLPRCLVKEKLTTIIKKAVL